MNRTIRVLVVLLLICAMLTAPFQTFATGSRITKCYVVSGKVSLPNNDTALEEIDVMIYFTDAKDETNVLSQHTVIKTGSKSADYSLEVLGNTAGYYVSYSLVGFNLYDCWVKEGYITKNGLVEDSKLKQKMIIDKNQRISFTLKEEKKVYDKARQIVKTAVKPTMTEYEKVRAIYDYITTHVYYDHEVYNSFDKGAKGEVYTGNKLSHAIADNKAVCVGITVAMDYLLHLAGIESEFRGGYGPLLESGHAWNAVKIDGNYYNLDATAGLRTGYSVRQKSVFRNYMTFHDEQLPPLLQLSREEKTLSSTSFDYCHNFYEFWMKNNMKVGTTTVLKGIAKLPEGKKAPVGGDFVRIAAVLGVDTKSEADDFYNSIIVHIPENESSAEYAITVIPSRKPYRVGVLSYKTNSVKEIDKVSVENAKGSNVLDIALDEQERAMEIVQGKIYTPDKKAASKDVKMMIFLERYDGTPAFDRNDVVVSTKLSLKKGASFAEFKIPVFKGSQDYLLSYEIMDQESTKHYQKIGYLGKTGTVQDYSKALKINQTKLESEYIIQLIKK